MKVYRSEITKHLFPINEKSNRALAIFRGSTYGGRNFIFFQVL